MHTNITTLNKLVNTLSRLPGLGHKSSIRIAQYIIDKDEATIKELIEKINLAKENIRRCKVCFSYTDNIETCHICEDVYRDKNIVCVVEKPFDVFTFERSGFKGLYHVLDGLLSPMDGVGEHDINLESLVNRVKNENIKEIIIALNQSVQGDTTTLLIAHELKGFDVKICRLARGVPVGASIDVVDDCTLNSAVEGRQIVIL